MERRGPRGPEGPLGGQGRQGAAGADGAHGLDGAQGPTGADGHDGQRGRDGVPATQGDRGETGKEGAAGKPTRTAFVLFAMTVAYVTFGWQQSEQHACMRTNGSRLALRIFATTAFDARSAASAIDRARGDQAAYLVDHTAALSYAKSIKTARRLDCSGLTPETK
jgi:hypothetical protein